MLTRSCQWRKLRCRSHLLKKISNYPPLDQLPKITKQMALMNFFLFQIQNQVRFMNRAELNWIQPKGLEYTQKASVRNEVSPLDDKWLKLF